jgi:hypothetical protein
MKYILLIFFLVISGENLLGQGLTVYINNKKLATTKISEDPAVISVSRSKYKKASRVTIILDKNSVNTVYKRTLEITGENENLLYQLTDLRSKAGVFKINLVPIKKKLTRQKVLKVYMAEDPANDMMKLPSKRNLLAEIHLK